MEAKILYFGYGANKSADMVNAIIGRTPDGFPFTLDGYELCVQSWKHIPPKARAILAGPWDEKFRSYSIRKAENNAVSGMVWLITKKERAHVRNWELIGKWYQEKRLRVVNAQGKVHVIITEIIEDQGIPKAHDNLNYPAFLNSKKKMLEVAAKCREE